ncbi:MAG: copper resistance protein NlpE [Tannerella sp.]|nr:copper resistance protein NlpE [Tannerella sp.]
MKKLWIIAIAMGIVSGCGGNPSKKKSSTDVQNEQEVIVLNDSHNAQNSLDYEGTYVGVMPSADGMEMIVTIRLGKDTYIKQTVYMGKEGVFEDQGSYTWDAEGFIITLNGITDAPDKYFVGENRIFQLDMEGNRITGMFADKYVLHKQ